MNSLLGFSFIISRLEVPVIARVMSSHDKLSALFRELILVL